MDEILDALADAVEAVLSDAQYYEADDYPAPAMILQAMLFDDLRDAYKEYLRKLEE